MATLIETLVYHLYSHTIFFFIVLLREKVSSCFEKSKCEPGLHLIENDTLQSFVTKKIYKNNNPFKGTLTDI